MPREWRRDGALPEGGEPGAAELRLWPHRSLDARGFAIFIGATFVLLLVPLVAVLGTSVHWVLLPFLMAALAMIWVALRRNSAETALTETLTLTRDRISLVRREPRGAVRRWDADPHWVSVNLHRQGGPVENYVTLRGGGREVEIGAFLSSAERLALRDELESILRRLVAGPASAGG
jgi:uncharacterized membrane protein